MTKQLNVDYPFDSSIRMHTGGSYSFFHKNSSPLDEPLLYRRIIDSATSYIEIFDPYFNYAPPNNDHEMFDSIQSGLTIKILTLKGLARNPPYLSDCWDAIKSRIPPVKNTRLGIRVINKGDPRNDNWHFHDRFLIIDRSKIYLIGSSIGWHIKVQDSTGICSIYDSDTSDFIQTLFDEYWQQAANNEISIRNLHP